MERTYVFNQDGGTGANNGLLRPFFRPCRAVELTQAI